MRGDLEHVLYSKLGDHAEVRFGIEVESVESCESGCAVALSDGTKLEGDLLVGADGVHSKVRALCFKDESQSLRYLHCNTAAFVIDRPPPSLRDSNAFSTLTAPGRQVATYPIRGGRLAAFFVHSSAAEPYEPCRSAASLELRARYGDLKWVVPELLRNMNESNLYFDTVSQVEIPRWSKPGVVLVGDAAYCVSLIAGQGASLAMAGAFLLADELGRASGNIGRAMERYEQKLRPAVEKKQAAGRAMVKWFVPSSGVHLAIRDSVMRLTAVGLAQPLLKRFFATESVFASVTGTE